MNQFWNNSLSIGPLAIAIVPLGLLTIIYWYAIRRYSYWSSRGISGPRPLFPVGNMLERARRLPNELAMEWQSIYGKVYGQYSGLEPILIVADHLLVKQILIKDFHLFINRRAINVEHSIFRHNLFNVESDQWKRIRTITSPSFTSGKLRSMNRLMNQCVDKLCHHLDRLCSESTNQRSAVFNVKDEIYSFTVDTIASTSFGTETNVYSSDGNLDDNRCPIIENASKFNEISGIVFLCAAIFPKSINNLLNIRHVFHRNSFDYFLNLLKQVVKLRTSTINKTKRNDLVQLLLDARVVDDELTSKQLTNDEVIAQCLLFFAAGYETVASSIVYCLYELAMNQDVQQRLLQELQSKLGDKGLIDKNGDQYYDQLVNHIPYLEAVIKESLRKYPPANFLERRLSADRYQLAGIELCRDQLVEIPIYAIHHNPEYYPNPESYNPDRFMPENKDQLVPYTYLPFGDGSRNCIGMRFAYQEIKLVLASIITRYRLEPTEQTQKFGLQFKRNPILLSPNSFQLKITRR